MSLSPIINNDSPTNSLIHRISQHPKTYHPPPESTAPEYQEYQEYQYQFHCQYHCTHHIHSSIPLNASIPPRASSLTRTLLPPCYHVPRPIINGEHNTLTTRLIPLPLSHLPFSSPSLIPFSLTPLPLPTPTPPPHYLTPLFPLLTPSNSDSSSTSHSISRS